MNSEAFQPNFDTQEHMGQEVTLPVEGKAVDLTYAIQDPNILHQLVMHDPDTSEGRGPAVQIVEALFKANPGFSGLLYEGRLNAPGRESMKLPEKFTAVLTKATHELCDISKTRVECLGFVPADIVSSVVDGFNVHEHLQGIDMPELNRQNTNMHSTPPVLTFSFSEDDKKPGQFIYQVQVASA